MPIARTGSQAAPPRFARGVYALVRRIPRGRVATYGQVAAILGHPRADVGALFPRVAKAGASGFVLRARSSGAASALRPASKSARACFCWRATSSLSFNVGSSVRRAARGSAKGDLRCWGAKRGIL